jgi:hypothetical protein
VPAGHLAHFVRETLRADLDLSRILESYLEERRYPRGATAHTTLPRLS